VVPEDDYFQSVLEATSERLVREAHSRAGISFERISVAIPIDDMPSKTNTCGNDGCAAGLSVGRVVRSDASPNGRRGRTSKEGS
jgi:hypothetical protein